MNQCLSWWIFLFSVNILVMTLKKHHSVLVLVNFLSKENCLTSFWLKSFPTSNNLWWKISKHKTDIRSDQSPHSSSDPRSQTDLRRRYLQMLSRILWRCFTEKLQNCSVSYNTSPDFISSSGGGEDDWVHINVWTAPLRQKVWNNSSSHTWRRTCRIQRSPTHIWHFLQHFQPSPRWRGQGLH